VVVRAGAGEGQDALAVRDGHGTHAGLLLDDGGQARGHVRAEALGQKVQGAFGDAQGAPGGGVAGQVVDVPAVPQDAHEQGRSAGVGQDHGEADDLHQGPGLREGAGQDQDDDHLQDLGHQHGETRGDRAQGPVLEGGAGAVEAHEAPDEAFHRGGDPAGHGREAAEREAVQAAEQPHRGAQEGPADEPRQHGADGPGVGDGAVDLDPHVGAAHRDQGEEHEQGRLLAEAQGLGLPEAVGGGLAVDVGHQEEERHHLDEGEQQLEHGQAPQDCRSGRKNDRIPPRFVAWDP